MILGSDAGVCATVTHRGILQVTACAVIIDPSRPRRFHMRYDLFVSYARADDAGGRVNEFVRRLAADFEACAGRPLRVFVDHESIRAMDRWKDSVLGALRESSLLLACVSPRYVTSEHCRWELVEFLKREGVGSVMGESVAPVILEDPGWAALEAAEGNDWLAELQSRQSISVCEWFMDTRRLRGDR